MAFPGPLDPQLLAPAAALLVVVLALYLTFAGFGMVGLTAGEVVVLLFLAPFLAVVNLPVWSLPGMVIGVNAAGAGVPVVLSARFMTRKRLPVWKAGVGTAAVTAVAYEVATVQPDQGILVPALPIILTAAVVGLLLANKTWEEVGPVTYASGALGTLIGADLLHIGEMVDPGRSEPLFAVIGGAGTLDAIFLVSLWAVGGTIVAVLVARVFSSGS